MLGVVSRVLRALPSFCRGARANDYINTRTRPSPDEQVYGGIPTACHLPNNPDKAVGKVITDVEDKWYDGKYLNHTMNGLDCYPVYMQVRERAFCRATV